MSSYKERIEELDYFMILATKNAMESRWVPWEIGIADSKKPIDRIAMIPVADASGVFHGNEYLQLYQTVEIGSNRFREGLAVFPPPDRINGVFLERWLAKGAG